MEILWPLLLGAFWRIVNRMESEDGDEEEQQQLKGCRNLEQNNEAKERGESSMSTIRIRNTKYQKLTWYAMKLLIREKISRAMTIP